MMILRNQIRQVVPRLCNGKQLDSIS